MVIFLNASGDAQIVTPEKVYQGSNDATDITVVAPLAATTAMNIGFILPNGLYWQAPPVNAEDPQSGGNYAPMTLIKQDMTTRANVWQYTLPRSVTERQGKVQIAVNAVSDVTYETATGKTTVKKNVTSYLCEFNVEESVLPDLPSAPEPDVYTLLTQYLAELDGRTVNVPNLVARIDKVAPNAFTYTNNSGLTSAPIVLDSGEAAPMPLGAASVVRVPSTGWTQSGESYTVVIGAGLHGQMRDGAVADDLWVSFSREDGEDFAGVYQGFTVNASGDITITVNTPVTMTVRVWNGKGLVDVTAREQIAAEIERAETAENDLQAQIDHIVDTGVDKLAREQIAAETARAEAAEQTLQDNINAATVTLQGQIAVETVRATTAENALSNRIAENTSDIQGLRDDFVNESHFKGLFGTVAELTAAYPTATPNDFAWIAGGNIWIWQDGAWTDSEKPVPSTAVPASNASPLMSGAASAGTSGAYARGDHRHPSDTTKLDKSGGELTGPIVSAVQGNGFISYKDEFNFCSNLDANFVTVNYRGAPSDKIIQYYEFHDGTGSGNLADIKAKNLYANGQLAITEAGGQFKGPVSFAGSSAVDNDGPLPYYLGIKAFADGGKIVYRTADQILSDLDAYSPSSPPIKTAQVMQVVFTRTPQSFNQGVIYDLSLFSIVGRSELIGGLLKIAGLLGYVISTTQFIALTDVSAFSPGTVGNLYYYTFG